MTNDTFTLSPPATPAGNTAAASDRELFTGARSEANKVAWEKIIDNYLVEWGRAPGELEEDGLEAPTRAVIARACDLAGKFRAGGVKPARVVPDGEGGISFDWSVGSTLYSLNVLSGPVPEIEVLIFEDCRLICRSRVP